MVHQLPNEIILKILAIAQFVQKPILLFIDKKYSDSVLELCSAGDSWFSESPNSEYSWFTEYFPACQNGNY